METQEKTDVHIDGTLIESNKQEPLKHPHAHHQHQHQKQPPGGESTDNLPSEEFLDEFQCCVCLELLYKPVVLACGHMSCFWCVYNAMNHVHESNCPICRCPYNHFPSVCKLLHFLLLKLYPVAYKRRERQVREEEKRAGHFSLQFDQNLVEPKLCEKLDILGNNHTHSDLQMDGHSESGSKDSESSSFRNAPKTSMQDENGITIKLMPFSEIPEVAADALNQEKTSLSSDSEHKDQKVVSVADILCAACNRLLV